MPAWTDLEIFKSNVHSKLWSLFINISTRTLKILAG